MSSAFQAVQLGDSFTDFGNFPDFTPAHQDDLLIGITARICAKRTKPIAGIVACVSGIVICITNLP
jgi:hypothetical protein